MLLDRGLESGIEVSFAAGVQDVESQPECAGGFLHLGFLCVDPGPRRIHEHGDLGYGRQQITNDSQPLWRKFGAEQRSAGYIAAWSVEACDQAD